MCSCCVTFQSRHLFTRELRDPEISVACAKVMAQFHQLTMPLVKQPRWLFDTMTRYATGDVKRSSKLRTSIYKFEFGLEACAIRFVVADSGVYLTSGAITWNDIMASLEL